MLSIGLCFILACRALAQFEVFSQQIPLPTTVNSPSDEFNLVLSPDGKQLYFTRKNHPENIGGAKDAGDIWVSEQDDSGQWTTPQNLSSLNDEQDNQVVGFLDQGKSLMIYTPRGFALSRRQAQGWSKPVLVTIPYFKPMSDALSASLSLERALSSIRHGVLRFAWRRRPLRLPKASRRHMDQAQKFRRHAQLIPSRNCPIYCSG